MQSVSLYAIRPDLPGSSHWVCGSGGRDGPRRLLLRMRAVLLFSWSLVDPTPLAAFEGVYTQTKVRSQSNAVAHNVVVRFFPSSRVLRRGDFEVSCWTSGLFLTLGETSCNGVCRRSRPAWKQVALTLNDDTSANPIRKVVKLLQDMQMEIEAEGEKEKDLFDKFMCADAKGSCSEMFSVFVSAWQHLDGTRTLF